MKAVIFEGTGADGLVVKDVPRPEIQEPTDAVVRVVRACVCGSDLWYYRGLTDMAPGSSIGHEAIGLVEEVGNQVSVAKEGDFVIVPFPFSCGHCPVCKAGFESGCPNGGFFGGAPGMGAQAEYLRVPQANGTLVVVPGGVERARDFSEGMLDSLLTLSDVMATGYHAAVSAEVKQGDTAVVIGDGAVGLCGVLSATLRGAERVVAMSRHQDRQELAKAFGATDIIPERGDEGVQAVMDLTGGYGADAILECVGSQEANESAFAMARPGAIVGRVGVPHDVTIPALETFYHNIGVRGGSATVHTYDVNGLLDQVLDEKINPGRVFTASFDLNHIRDAYRAMDQRKAIKSLLKVSEI